MANPNKNQETTNATNDLILEAGVDKQTSNMSKDLFTNTRVSIYDKDKKLFVTKLLKLDEYIYQANSTEVSINLPLHISRYSDIELPGDNYDVTLSFEKDTNFEVFVKEISQTKTEVRLGLVSAVNSEWTSWLNTPTLLYEAFNKILNINGGFYRIINAVPDFEDIEERLIKIDIELTTKNEELKTLNNDLQHGLPSGEAALQMEVRINQLNADITNLLNSKDEVYQYGSIIIKLDHAIDKTLRAPEDRCFVFTETYSNVNYKSVYIFNEQGSNTKLIEIPLDARANDVADKSTN
jgi:hypothetical protein